MNFKLSLAVILFTILSDSVNTHLSDVKETILRPGTEYRYSYKSQVLTGIRSVSDQHTGLAIHCDVCLQILRNGSSLLKLEHVQLFQVHDAVPSRSAGEPLSERYMSRLTGELADVILMQLVKPVQFRYNDGEIQNLKTSLTDQYWSVNIKKGLLSLMQLKLNQISSQTLSNSYESKLLYPQTFGHNPWPTSRLLTHSLW